jgi:hypothetical protein
MAGVDFAWLRAGIQTATAQISATPQARDAFLRTHAGRLPVALANGKPCQRASNSYGAIDAANLRHIS